MAFSDDTGLEHARRRMLDTLLDLEQLEVIGDTLIGLESPRLAAERYEKAAIAADLEKREREAERARAAWAAEKKTLRFKAAAMEQALTESRNAAGQAQKNLQRELDELRGRFDAARTLWQNEEQRLKARVASFEDERADWEKTRDALIDERAGLRKHVDAFRAEMEARLIRTNAALERERNLRTQTEELRGRDREALTAAQQTLTRLKEQAATLQKALQAARKDGESPPVPASDLDPAWGPVLARLEGPVANAYAHLRRLSRTQLAAGARAVLKLAAAELVAMRDHLHALRVYLEETGAAPAPGRLEGVLGEALTRWEPLLRARRIILLRKIGALPPLNFDAESMGAALHQLLKNVHEALPHGGTLTVEAARDEKGGVAVTFSDTGPGFPPDVLQGPFTPFRPRAAGRLGIGLPLVRRVARALGGDVETANNEPRGAKVTLRLPAPPANGDPLV